jgi:hypothetical protein
MKEMETTQARLINHVFRLTAMFLGVLQPTAENNINFNENKSLSHIPRSRIRGLHHKIQKNSRPKYFLLSPVIQWNLMTEQAQTDMLS